MVGRLIIGLLKGTLLGAALTAVLHFGLGVTVMSGVLAYLFAALVTGLAGVFAGQPPWRQGAWVGSILKGVFGLALGAGLYALAAHFLKVQLPAVAGIPAGTEFAQAPLVFAPALAALYAGLIELDDGGAPEEDASANAPKGGVRVGGHVEEGEEEEVPAPRADRGKSRNRA